jgi:hypothetical protein
MANAASFRPSSSPALELPESQLSQRQIGRRPNPFQCAVRKPGYVFPAFSLRYEPDVSVEIDIDVFRFVWPGDRLITQLGSSQA